MRWSASSRHRENLACHIHAPTPSTTATSADLGTRDRLVLVASEFVVDAWRMVVPKKRSRAYDFAHPDGPG